MSPAGLGSRMPLIPNLSHPIADNIASGNLGDLQGHRSVAPGCFLGIREWQLEAERTLPTWALCPD